MPKHTCSCLTRDSRRSGCPTCKLPYRRIKQSPGAKTKDLSPFPNTFWLDPISIPASVRREVLQRYLKSHEHVFLYKEITKGSLVKLQGPAFPNNETAVLTSTLSTSEDEVYALFNGAYIKILRDEIAGTVN